MAYEIVIPRLDWNMEEGALVEWLKKDGETVRQGDMVCTIEGDKAAMEIESFESGLLKIPEDSPSPGQTVPVGTLLGYVLTEQEWESFDAGTVSDKRIDPLNRKSGDPAISPRARRAARTNGIDWRLLIGSGRAGRIVEKDVLEAITQKERSKTRSGDQANPETVDPETARQGRLRGAIARHMVDSHCVTAPVTLTTEADVTALSPLTKEPFQPSWYALLSKIAAAALTEHPLLNASWRDDGVVFNENIHIGIAVDTPEGVVVPVIRNVPGKSLQEVSSESRKMIEAAQGGGNLTADHLEGGTFTLTNLGMYEIDAFTPIIHLPQCAILGLGRVRHTVAVLDEASASMGIRKVMSLSLTFDHRIVDGAPAARFLRRIKQLAENAGEVFT